MLYLATIVLISCSLRLSAQGFSTTRLESVAAMPLLIAQRAPAGQPIRFLAGDSGSIRALEIDAAATTWIRGPLSLGNLVGAASNERMRIGALDPTGGMGLVISLLGTSASTGLLVSDIGASGTDNAAVVLQSTSNGTGTGIRIGGPLGSTRPTLSTGIDITGGTGLRYNALSTGNGTALEIGGTTPPRRGIEVVASGTAHIGVLASANTNGAGVIGLSQSSSYTNIPPTERVGVRGHAATNSTISADTIIGAMGSSVRGGTGGTLTTSVGVLARSDASGTSHAGTSIGIIGTATAYAPGRAVAIGGFFVTDEKDLSIVALGGDVYLGSSDDARPLQLTRSTASGYNGQTRTYVYDLHASGHVEANSMAITGAEELAPGPGVVNNHPTSGSTVVRIAADATVTELTGCAGGRPGRIMVIIATAGVLRLTNEGAGSLPENRFRLQGANDLLLPQDASAILWYDEEIQRWRTLSY
ncbi:MAG: hypothetical protein IPH49_02730 [Ignavibacteria bacterium]|nr:hypothetical protein [Ignavibacteria bacterium]